MLQAHGQIVSVMYGIEQIGNLAGIADDMDILGSGNVEGNALYKANSLHNGVSFQLDFLAFFRENRYAVLIGAYYLKRIRSNGKTYQWNNNYYILDLPELPSKATVTA